jgi:predicted amidohydrolase YtcJ
MRTLFYFSFIVLFFAFLWSCKKESTYADVIFINGNIYTVDSLKPSASVIAISNHRIIGLGDKNIIEKYKNADTKIIDLKNSFVMPGFIEGHGHFGGFGEGLQNLNFLHSKSWDDVIKLVEEKVKTAKPGEFEVSFELKSIERHSVDIYFNSEHVHIDRPVKLDTFDVNKIRATLSSAINYGEINMFTGNGCNR